MSLKSSPGKMRFERIWMPQPATLRPDSNVGQQNTTYRKLYAMHLVSMLHLQMLVSELVILILGIHKQHWYHSTNGSS